MIYLNCNNSIPRFSLEIKVISLYFRIKECSFNVGLTDLDLVIGGVSVVSQARLGQTTGDHLVSLGFAVKNRYYATIFNTLNGHFGCKKA